MNCNHTQYYCGYYHVRICILVISMIEIYFAILFTLRERLRTSDSVLSRVRSKNNYDFTLDALTLKPSDACNAG